jgi:hypothetical protein
MTLAASFIDPDLIQQIRDFRKLSAFDKLRMLDEIHRFLEIATPVKTKRIRDVWPAQAQGHLCVALRAAATLPAPQRKRI